MSGADYVEVSRTAHPTAAGYGRNAHLHAAQWSQKAEAARRLNEAAFWNGRFRDECLHEHWTM